MASPSPAPSYEARPLGAADLDRLVEIERMSAGDSRRRFFAKRLAAAAADPGDFVHVGVTSGGVLRGFAIAHLLRGEFGRKDAVAVLDALAVEPESRDRGMGRALMQELDATLRRAGVGSLQSQIDWRRHDLVRFFDAAGFSLAPRVALQRSVTEPLGEAVEET